MTPEMQKAIGLTTREVLILIARDKDCRTLDDIAKEHKVSRARVDQLYRKASRKIKWFVLYSYPVGDEPEDRSAMPLHFARLSVRAHNALFTAGVRTLGDAAKLTASDILKIRNCGIITLTEIARVLAEHGLTLAREWESGSSDSPHEG